MESGGGAGPRGAGFKESVNLVSVGGWVVCVCRGLECWPWSWVWTQCLPQGSRRLRQPCCGNATAGFPKKLGGPGLRRGGVGGYNLHSVPTEQSPPTVALWHTNHEQAVSVWMLIMIQSSSSSCHQTSVFHLSTHFFAVSLNLLRSYNEQGCARMVHCIKCAVFFVARPHSHVVSPS